MWAGIAQSVQRPRTGYTFRKQNRGAVLFFSTLPDLLWGPSSLLYNWYRVSELTTHHRLHLAQRLNERVCNTYPPPALGLRFCHDEC